MLSSKTVLNSQLGVELASSEVVSPVSVSISIHIHAPYSWRWKVIPLDSRCKPLLAWRDAPCTFGAKCWPPTLVVEGHVTCGNIPRVNSESYSYHSLALYTYSYQSTRLFSNIVLKSRIRRRNWWWTESSWMLKPSTFNKNDLNKGNTIIYVAKCSLCEGKSIDSAYVGQTWQIIPESG